MRALAIALVALCAVSAYAAEVVVFGDSWGAFAERPFQQMFHSRGYDIDVYNVAIGGTTARYWARQPNSLVDFVKENPDCKWVWLSIGGNDAMFELALRRPIDVILAEALNHTREFIDPLLEYDPNIQIVQFGYDIVNFEMTSGCKALGRLFLPDCETTACRNNEMYRLQYEYVEELNKYYPKNHNVVNLLGTLQSARPDLVPGPYPNDDYYSPAELMQDCIHPSSEGFTALFDVMWEQYWAGQVSKLRPLKR